MNQSNITINASRIIDGRVRSDEGWDLGVDVREDSVAAARSARRGQRVAVEVGKQKWVGRKDDLIMDESPNGIKPLLFLRDAQCVAVAGGQK